MNSTSDSTGGGIFYLPEIARTSAGPRAPLITTAGLAGAANRADGAIVEMPSGRLTNPELIDKAVVVGSGHSPRRRRPPIPQVVTTAAKDVRTLAEARRFRSAASRTLNPDADIGFVWQRHEAFHDVGVMAADRLQVPLVISVHALKVREAEEWGVRRPGWGTFMERKGELDIIAKADVISCVSDEVASRLDSLGRFGDRLLVLPNGVDTNLFTPGPPRQELLEDLDLVDRFVIGWTGSFRAFHALNVLIDAFRIVQAEHTGASLLLVGNGAGRAKVKSRIEELGLRSVHFAGSVPFLDMPKYVRAMDVCVLPAGSSDSFHYSPTKLREYLSCGRATVVSEVGEMARHYSESAVVSSVPPDSPRAMADALLTLAGDRRRRDEMGSQARTHAERNESWDGRYQVLADAIEDL